MNLTLTLSPRRIILGGGVMEQPQLIPLIRGKLMSYLNNYLLIPQVGRDIDNYVVSPGLGARSGLLGALALGRMALDQKQLSHS
jgi:fructokinase